MNSSLSPSIKQFYIENLGCAKNQVDAEVLIEFLTRAGWAHTREPEDADVILVNSCGFIAPAKEESIQTLLDFRKRYREKRIILAGCLAQRYGETLANSLTEADGFFGNRDLPGIADFLENLSPRNRVWSPSAETTGEEVNPASPRRTLLSYPGSAYLKISEGCDNRCFYCAIPLIRGPLRSRPARDILREAEGLVEQGVREIILIGQDCASYGKDLGTSLPFLLKRFQELPGDFRLRVLYLHPDNFTDDILPLIREDKRFIPYFDIPFQHASQKILASMGRRGNAEGYLELLKRIRGLCPEAVIRSTFIVGFPGEGKEEFKRAADFLVEAQLDWAGFFLYSREEDTPAYSMRGGVGDFFAKKPAEKRKKILEEIQSEITPRKLQRYVGMEMQVLLEEAVEGEPLYLGRGGPHAPEVDGLVVVKGEALQPGTIVPVLIEKVNGVDLEGTAAKQPGGGKNTNGAERTGIYKSS